MRVSRWLGRGGLLLLVAWSGAACNELLGIEEAAVDPRFDDEGGAGQSPVVGGSAGTGGSSGSSGSSATGGSSGNTSLSGGSAGEAAETNGGESGMATESPGGGGGEAPTAGGGGELATGGTSGNGGTAGGGGTSGSTVAEGGAGGESTPASMCETYCREITSYCVGSLQQYVDEEQCLRVCELLPQGTLGEATGNTVACRLKSAADARYASGVERGRYCRRAGPGGDGGCGTNCEGFCSLMEGVCTAEDAELYRFANTAECLSACALLPDGEVPYSTSDEAVSDGNSVQCRLFHVNSAAMLDPLEHCEHAMGFTLCESAEASEHEH
jgi:hypothetical protein